MPAEGREEVGVGGAIPDPVDEGQPGVDGTVPKRAAGEPERVDVGARGHFRSERVLEYDEGNLGDEQRVTLDAVGVAATWTGFVSGADLLVSVDSRALFSTPVVVFMSKLGGQSRAALNGVV